MFLLSELPKITDKGKRRVGRGYGSGAGAKSGRGTKRHQKAREKIKIWFEGGQNRMVKKFPLLRGKSKNKSAHMPTQIVNLSDLSRITKGEDIDNVSLVAYEIIREKDVKSGVKLLGKGEVSQAYIVKIPVSKTARTKIEAAGGKVL